MPSRYDYDAIIIGAGISGLVCGCYLAKAGMKTLIVEKNAKPGGYCTSFQKKGFTFDACAHSIGGLGKGGAVRKVVKDLGLDARIGFTKCDPSDVIVTSDHTISFWSDLGKTVRGLQNHFPGDAAGIESLFSFINDVKGFHHIKLRKKTLKELLDGYIKNAELASIFSFLAYGNLGLPPSQLSAFTAVKFYKQFIFDGGYYPDHQIQEFPDQLAARFKEFGGQLALSERVHSILIKNQTAIGITLKNNESVRSRFVISNADAMQTFFTLTGKQGMDREQESMLRTLVPSVSFFILYLGIDDRFHLPAEPGSNLWYLSDYDLDRVYETGQRGNPEDIRWYMSRIMPNKKSILCFTNAPYHDREYWRERKDHYRDLFIQKVEKVMPGLSEHILYKDAATPHTLYRWTLNYRGSAYGWASMPSQFAIPDISKRTWIGNLYMTGHWTTLAQGIPGVVYLGRDTANTILRREKNRG